MPVRINWNFYSCVNDGDVQPCRLYSLSASPPYLDLIPQDLEMLPFTPSQIPYMHSDMDAGRQANSKVVIEAELEVLGFDTEWYSMRSTPFLSLVKLTIEDVCVLWAWG